jgi:hypothetical protein
MNLELPGDDLRKGEMNKNLELLKNGDPPIRKWLIRKWCKENLYLHKKGKHIKKI